MSRLRWPDSTNSVSDVPGTIQLAEADETTLLRVHRKTEALQVDR